jgi:integrase
VLSLRWDQIDWERAQIILPDSKTGLQYRFVGEAVLDYLSRLPWREETEYVIPGRNPRQHLVNLTKGWHRIRARAGLEDVRIHDLRHTHASAAAGLGMSLPMIGKLLGHTQAATTERYAHLADNPMAAAASAVAEHLDTRMRTRAPSAPDDG